MPTIPIAKLEKFIAGDEDSPFTVKFAWLDAEGKRLMATDGHRAIRVNVELTEGDITGLIPVEVFELARKELKTISKAMDKGTLPDPWLKTSCGATEIVIDNLLSNTKHLVHRPNLPEGTNFPAVDAVFPNAKGGPTIILDRTLLAEMCAALDGSASLGMWVSARDKAVVFGTPDGKAVALLMPMKGDLDGAEVVQRGKAKS